MTLPHIDSFGFTTADAEASAAFFASVLGFQRLGEAVVLEGGPYAQLVGLPGAHLKLLRLAIGAEVLELTEVLGLPAGIRPGRPIPADSRSNDRWFQHGCLVVNDMAAALARLQPAFAAGRITPISSAPQRLPDWNTAAAGIVAYKFRDPEGHPLELLQFPPDKGEARWHVGAPGPLLGVDHSAIGIADTAASGRFYRQLLGLTAGGDGVNAARSRMASMVWWEPGCTSPATAAPPAPGWRASTTANPPVAGRCPPTRAPRTWPTGSCACGWRSWRRSPIGPRPTAAV